MNDDTSTAPQPTTPIDPEWDRVFDLFARDTSAGQAIRQTVTSFARDVPIPNLAAHAYALVRTAIIALTSAEAARVRARADARRAARSAAAANPDAEIEELLVQRARVALRLRELGVSDGAPS